MRHTLSIFFLVGWFFSFSYPLPGSKTVRFDATIGPFPSEAVCKALFDDLISEMVKVVSPLKVEKCEERKES